jgi:hypothetical protein
MSLDEDYGYGFGGNEFDRFDVDEFTSTHDDGDVILGLMDDTDLSSIRKSAAYTTMSDLDKEDTDAFNHVTGGGFDPAEFADPEESIVVPVTTYKSKMEHARAIYKREQDKGTIVRKNIVKLFIDEANCTPAGAATYYATIHTK